MEKLYFIDEDSNHCYSLQQHLEEADNSDTEITLIEAIPDDGTADFIWCHVHEAVEKCDCTKKLCKDYHSKSGRGKCDNKGKLYLHGERVTFKTN